MVRDLVKFLQPVWVTLSNLISKCIGTQNDIDRTKKKKVIPVNNVCCGHNADQVRAIMTSSIGKIFRVTGPLWGESTGRQWRGALVFSLMSAWTNVWINTGVAGDLRRHDAHCDVTVIPGMRGREVLEQAPQLYYNKIPDIIPMTITN